MTSRNVSLNLAVRAKRRRVSVRAGFERWLADANFDEQGRQRLRLSELTAACRVTP